MFSLLLAEWMKFKRSKLLVFTVILFLAIPFLLLLMAGKYFYGDYSAEWHLLNALKNICSYFGVLTPPVCSVFAIFLFTHEYAEKTVKTISSVPIGNARFLITKLLALFIWILLISVFVWLCSILISVCFRPHFHFAKLPQTMSLIFEYLGRFLLSGLLVFLAVSPVICITVLSRNAVIPILFSIIFTIFITFTVYYTVFDLFFPWTCIYYLTDSEEYLRVIRATEGRITQTGVNWIASLTILVPAIVSYAVSYLAMNRRDIC